MATTPTQLIRSRRLWLLIAYLAIWLASGVLRGESELRTYLAGCDPFCDSGHAHIEIQGGFPPFLVAKLDYGVANGIPPGAYLGHQVVLLEPITGFVFRLAVG